MIEPFRIRADPADAFDVVVPDMPGFGHSDRPAGAPLDSIAVAGRWAELMTAVGYERFGVAGGDIGSSVSRYLALDHPARVVAVHRMEASMPVDTGADYAPEERAYLRTAAAWRSGEGAYAEMHRTKPQTAAVGLTDSPAGLAAWIVEKLRAWSDCGGELERSFSRSRNPRCTRRSCARSSACTAGATGDEEGASSPVRTDRCGAGAGPMKGLAGSPPGWREDGLGALP